MATDVLGYSGKRVIVSGCFSGIGEATARRLAELGAEVHGLDWQVSALDLASFTQLDLRDPSSIDRAVHRIGGQVDALFNCAGVPPGAPPLDVMKVNFLGARHLTAQVLPRMPRGGAIANVASNGAAGWPRRVPELLGFVETETYEAGVAWCEANAASVAEGYRFSKEAIIVWTMASSAPLIGRGIRINCTSPGAVQTPMLVEIEKTTPSAAIDVVAAQIGRRSSADEQAWPLLFLNSPAASYVNGVALPVDGGFMAAVALGLPPSGSVVTTAIMK